MDLKGLMLNKVSQRKTSTYVLTYTWSLKIKATQLIDTDYRLVVSEIAWLGVGKMSGESQKVQTSNYKIKKPWGYGDVMYILVIVVNILYCIFESC